MKLNINPMEQLIKRAERRINLHCAVSNQDLAHDRKRTLAYEHMKSSKKDVHEGFAQAAKLEGCSVKELAEKIISKPDVLMEKENARRKLILKVRAAQTPQELETIMTENKIPPHFADSHNRMI